MFVKLLIILLRDEFSQCSRQNVLPKFMNPLLSKKEEENVYVGFRNIRFFFKMGVYIQFRHKQIVIFIYSEITCANILLLLLL